MTLIPFPGKPGKNCPIHWSRCFPNNLFNIITHIFLSDFSCKMEFLLVCFNHFSPSINFPTTHVRVTVKFDLFLAVLVVAGETRHLPSWLSCLAEGVFCFNSSFWFSSTMAFEPLLCYPHWFWGTHGWNKQSLSSRSIQLCVGVSCKLLILTHGSMTISCWKEIRAMCYGSSKQWHLSCVIRKLFREEDACELSFFSP